MDPKEGQIKTLQGEAADAQKRPIYEGPPLFSSFMQNLLRWMGN
jgi:hypothetical protein